MPAVDHWAIVTTITAVLFVLAFRVFPLRAPRATADSPPKFASVTLNILLGLPEILILGIALFVLVRSALRGVITAIAQGQLIAAVLILSVIVATAASLCRDARVGRPGVFTAVFFSIWTGVAVYVHAVGKIP